jgi:hypothetical protein
LLVAIALLVVLGCVGASATRLRFALEPTFYDPRVLEQVLARWKGAEGGLARFESLVAGAGEAAWEVALLGALRARSEIRAAVVNEQLTELDHLLQRWARVPRVCASICSSAGFLLAAMVLRASLLGSNEGAAGTSEMVDAAVFQALDVAALGLSGTAFCIAAQIQARRAAAASAGSYDRLVERLEAAARQPVSAGASGLA